MYLDKYEEIAGVIRCLSGVRIGGNNNVIEIGTIDNPIIRNPITNHPYLPGSSIKGKMRSVLELSLRPNGALNLSLKMPQMKLGKDRKGKPEMNPCNCGECVVCKLFGSGNTNTTFEPSRLIFRDCLLTPESAQTLQAAAQNSGVFFAEIKPGVQMNRATNTVAQNAFFNFERVPEGTEFDFEMVLKLYGDLDEKAQADYRKTIAYGLRLIEKEGIGGKISAGYGKVRFENLKWDGTEWDFRTQN